MHFILTAAQVAWTPIIGLNVISDLEIILFSSIIDNKGLSCLCVRLSKQYAMKKNGGVDA
jgi:hypothetical protein